MDFRRSPNSHQSKSKNLNSLSNGIDSSNNIFVLLKLNGVFKLINY